MVKTAQVAGLSLLIGSAGTKGPLTSDLLVSLYTLLFPIWGPYDPSGYVNKTVERNILILQPAKRFILLLNNVGIQHSASLLVFLSENNTEPSPCI